MQIVADTYYEFLYGDVLGVFRFDFSSVYLLRDFAVEFLFVARCEKPVSALGARKLDENSLVNFRRSLVLLGHPETSRLQPRPLPVPVSLPVEPLPVSKHRHCEFLKNRFSGHVLDETAVWNYDTVLFDKLCLSLLSENVLEVFNDQKRVCLRPWERFVCCPPFLRADEEGA